MQKYEGQVLNQFGRPVAAAIVTVYLSGSLTPASLYSSDSTSSGTTNPIFGDSTGFFSFYAADGLYDLAVSGTTIATITRTAVTISDPIGSSSAADAPWHVYSVFQTILDFDGLAAAPALSSTDKGRIYFDTVLDKLRMSENGGAFTNLGSGGSSSHVLLDSTVHTDTLTHTVVLGDTIFGNSTPKWAALAGNVTTTKKLLSQTGDGAISAAPVWSTLIAGDLPTHVHSAADITSGTLPETRGGTDQSTYTLGDILYSDATNNLAKLAGNTTTGRRFLTQTGNGSVSAAPAWTGDFTPLITVTPVGAVVTIDASLGSSFKITIVANITTLTVNNSSAGQEIAIEIIQDATGNWTWTWPGTFKGGMVIFADPSGTSLQKFFYDGTNYIGYPGIFF